MFYTRSSSFWGAFFGLALFSFCANQAAIKSVVLTKVVNATKFYVFLQQPFAGKTEMIKPGETKTWSKENGYQIPQNVAEGSFMQMWWSKTKSAARDTWFDWAYDYEGKNIIASHNKRPKQTVLMNVGEDAEVAVKFSERKGGEWFCLQNCGKK